MAKKAKRVGILTAGGDSPGLNAAIRGFGKAAIGHHGMELVGFQDGIRGTGGEPLRRAGFVISLRHPHRGWHHLGNLPRQGPQDARGR